MRVAIRDWCASRRITSVMFTFDMIDSLGGWIYIPRCADSAAVMAAVSSRIGRLVL